MISRIAHRIVHPFKTNITNAIYYKVPPPPKPVGTMTIPEINAYNDLVGMKDYYKWWCYTWIIMAPATLIAAAYSFWTEYQHFFGPHAHPAPPYIPYEILESVNPVPFKDGRALFFNPAVNTLPGVGYLWRDDFAKWEENEAAREAAAGEEEEEEEDDDE